MVSNLTAEKKDMREEMGGKNQLPIKYNMFCLRDKRKKGIFS